MTDGAALPAVSVNANSPVPPYEQVRVQVTEMIQAGILAQGDRLPPLRQLAADLGLAVGTVARAYRELENAGLIRAHRGGGTRVVGRPSLPAQQERAEMLRGAAARFVQQARQLQADDVEILALVKRALGA